MARKLKYTGPIASWIPCKKPMGELFLISSNGGYLYFGVMKAPSELDTI